MRVADHERLHVYHRALAVAIRAEEVAREIPSRRGDLADQIRRASASISLNIAEGAAEFSPAEKRRFYRMARRSAIETLAILDLIHVIQPQPGLRQVRSALLDVVAMLTALCKR